MVIALLENELAGDQACPPFINLVSVLAAVSVNVFLRDAVNDLMLDPEVFTRLPALAMMVSLLPLTRVMTAPMG